MKVNGKSESELNRMMCNVLRTKFHAEVLTLVAGEMQTDGWPDRYITHRLLGGGHWFEAKLVKEPLRPNQQVVFDHLEEHLQPVFIIRFMPAPVKHQVWRHNGGQVAEFNGIGVDGCKEFLHAMHDYVGSR